MHKFQVWAPGKNTVSVVIADRQYPLQAGPNGWWSASVPEAGPGTDYAFTIDGGDLAVPDPRSQWQPQGVHGPSRLVDHKSFTWHDQDWQPPAFPSAIVYELHPGTFTSEGTLDAARARLPSLKDLGITHVELLPVAAFPGRHGWGYDGVSLFAVHEPYGGPEALKRFVDACHSHGLAVILDVVYNHLGPSGNYLAMFAPYFTHLHNTPWGDAVNLEDAGSHEVRRFFCDNALMWLREYHFDGLRLDAVHAYMDRSAINFMEQLSHEVRSLEAQTGRHYTVIAESDLNDPRLVTSPESGGYGMDAQWSDDFHHALVTVLTGNREGYYSDFGSLADLAKSLRSVFVYDGIFSPYRDRVHGRPVKGLPGWRFLGYSQNHDQVGNRARGERLVHLAGAARAKIAAALELTSPFVPCSSRARNGAHPHPSSTSPIMKTRNWAASSPKAVKRNSPPSAGIPTSSRTPRPLRLFKAPSCTGTKLAKLPTPRCSPGTNSSSSCAAAGPSSPAARLRRSTSASTRSSNGSPCSAAGCWSSPISAKAATPRLSTQEPLFCSPPALRCSFKMEN